MKKTLLIIAFILVLAAVVQRVVTIPPEWQSQIQKLFPRSTSQSTTQPYKLKDPEPSAGLTERESQIVDVVQKSLPSVVTIGIKATAQTRGSIAFDPSNPFSPFREVPGEERTIEQNIGSGFIVSEDGLVISNRHVVELVEAEYSVLTNDGKEYEVTQIYRDPLNDLAILKINANNLAALPLGDSSSLKLGQTAIAIGTPLGEFRNTVTTGVISGVGRGITAGSPFEGYVEKLDNVIQTDAAISAGNSGGPLLNSSGQVIGINTAVSAQGQNIGFAIPSNVVKELIDSFNARGGSFERPYIGVRYKIIDRQNAVLNDLVEGAYIIDVITDSPADKAGLLAEDIIMEFDGQRVRGNDDQELAKMILEKNVGDTINLQVWRNGEVLDLQLTLTASNE